MSIVYAEPASNNFMSGTGADLYDLGWLYPDELEADQSRTHIVPTNVKDPVLRDVLVAFQDGLIHRLSDITTRISVSWTRDWAIEPLPTALASYAGVWLPAAYLTAPFVGTVTSQLTPNFGAIEIWTSGFGHPSDVRGLPVEPVVQLPLLRSVFPSTSPPLAVEAVEDISNWLGVPAADVFRATGVRKRTYQEWKKSGTRRPRRSSEGRLWELHQLAADLVETLGLMGVRSWFKQDPDRSRLLRAGEFDRLASQAYSTRTTQRPPWVGVGSPESRAVTPRRMLVGRMDPGDVVEPNS